MPEYPRHLATFDYVGVFQYFLTFCTFERLSHFSAAESVGLVHQQILRACDEQDVIVLAYCYMPDHVHFVVETERPESNAKLFVAAAKQYSGFYFKKATAQRLWQRYGYERVLRNEEETVAFIRYTVENPIRAGLVQSPIEYPFWGSSRWTREELLEHIRRAA